MGVEGGGHVVIQKGQAALEVIVHVLDAQDGAVHLIDVDGQAAPVELVLDEVPQEVVDTPVVCDCLLYTSPSPRDKRRTRMPSSA